MPAVIIPAESSSSGSGSGPSLSPRSQSVPKARCYRERLVPDFIHRRPAPLAIPTEDTAAAPAKAEPQISPITPHVPISFDELQLLAAPRKLTRPCTSDDGTYSPGPATPSIHRA